MVKKILGNWGQKVVKSIFFPQWKQEKREGNRKTSPEELRKLLNNKNEGCYKTVDKGASAAG